MSKAATFEMTLHVRDHCLCLAAQRAARTLARRFDEALRPAGLTSGQFSLLTSLNRPDAPSVGEVAEVLGMDRTTLTANLKPLERRGLMETRVDPEDRRSRQLALTEAGLQVLEIATPIWVRVHTETEALLQTPQEVRTGLRALG
jgi:DNA-binding MarR family transcriptional regulator